MSFYVQTQPAIQPGLNEIPIEAFKPVGDLQQAATFSNYTVRIYRENDSGLGCFEVLCDQKRIYAQSGVKFQVGGTFDGNNQERPLPMGADITGAGQPNLVVLEWTGGAHCCYKYHVFEIGKAFRPVASISAADGIAKFEDLDHYGLQEVILGDFTFAYQFACYAQTPVPKVILHYRDGGYVLDPKLMQAPAPALAELRAKAKKVCAVYQAENRNPEQWGSPTDLWAEMLTLIYTGHEDLAWQFFELSWPVGMPGKQAGQIKFKEVLNGSPFYQEMLAELDNTRH